MKGKALLKVSKYLYPIFSTPSKDDSEWFGYYNYDTLNFNKTLMLCNRISVDGVAPEKGQTINLGCYEIKTGKWHHIGVSNSWNWQQGAMMQWLPGVGNESKVIYNCTRDGHLASCIHDIATGENIKIDWPIYGLTPDGKKSISLDLERSYWCRAYHYQSVANSEKDGRIFEEDGVFEIDLKTNRRKCIISINDVIAKDSRTYFNTYKHWLEHVMISPNGKRICFLHRFSPENDIYNYSTRLCIADLDGTNLKIVPDWEKQSLSHFGWHGDDEFVIYTVLSSPLGGGNGSVSAPSYSTIYKRKLIQLLKTITPQSVIRRIRANDKGYYHYKVAADQIILTNKWQGGLLDIDGHPSFTPDGRFMLTDSYPNSKGYQRLLLLEVETGRQFLLGEFFAGLKGNPASCDLHPKLSRDGKIVVIDTAYDKVHHMLAYEINWLAVNKNFGYGR